MPAEPLVVIGGGPGGYTAAFLAADLGMHVTLVEAEPQLGGVCLHRGCIPSKTLLHAAKTVTEARQAERWGIAFGAPRIDAARLRAWKEQVIGKMAGGLDMLAKKRNLRRVQGRAVFADAHTIVVDGKERLPFAQAIAAVGSSPALPPEFAGIAHPALMDSTAALNIESVPERLLVVGGGYIGLEMGAFYAALGSKVTVAEITGGLLPGVDRDLVRPLFLRLRKEFKQILLNTRLKELRIVDDCAHVRLELETGPVDEVFDKVLFAVGRKPNTAALGLEKAGVKLDGRGFIVVDTSQRTANPSVFAIGDAAGGAMLAHKAMREAKVAVENIAGKAAAFTPRAIPAVVYTDPEIAYCGLTEFEAAARHIPVTAASFPWAACGRAGTLDRPEGLTKLLVDPATQRILGVGMVGSGAGELIAEGVLAVEQGMTASALAACIHPHPTLSETLMEAAEIFSGHPTHIFRKCEGNPS